jgi:long-chain fatty acid transport protein
MSRQARHLAVGSLLSAASVLPAHATEGYFALGFGPVQRGQGGAGVAQEATDAMATALNPAAVAGLGRQMSLGVEFVAPSRGYTASGTSFVAQGPHGSGTPLFPIPNFAYNLPLDNGAVLNFAAYGNGGLNTDYGGFTRTNPCPPGTPGTGVFCFGPAGVNLSQLFLSVTYARKNGALSWGIAPTVAVQAFEAKGLQAFGAASVDPAHLSNTGLDWSVGVGLRGGVSVEVSPTLRLGISGQTKIKMSKFDEYAGLFADGGGFDIPAQATIGAAWQATPDLTVMLDYQKIFYSGVGSVSNAGDAGPLGAAGGAGFGWDDVDVVKLGIEWKQSDTMTWRAGYAKSSNPLGPEDVTLGILAPGVVEDHFTLGGSFQANNRDKFDFAIMYAPNVAVSGPEATPFGVTPGSDVTVDMDQFALSVGWSRKF